MEPTPKFNETLQHLGEYLSGRESAAEDNPAFVEELKDKHLYRARTCVEKDKHFLLARAQLIRKLYANGLTCASDWGTEEALRKDIYKMQAAQAKAEELAKLVQQTIEKAVDDIRAMETKAAQARGES